MVPNFHIFVKPFSKSRAAGALKMAQASFNMLIIHDFVEFVKLKCQENEKIPQFLEILTQRAVGCQIKLTIPLLMIHELSNFVKFFVKKNSAVSVFHRYRFGFCRDRGMARDRPSPYGEIMHSNRSAGACPPRSLSPFCSSGSPDPERSRSGDLDLQN